MIRYEPGGTKAPEPFSSSKPWPDLFTLAPFSDPDTSREAAKSIEPHLERLEALVLNAIRSQMPLGATDDELEQLTGLRHQTCSARRRALVLRGLVREMGATRTTRSGRRAKVWEEASRES